MHLSCSPPAHDRFQIWLFVRNRLPITALNPQLPFHYLKIQFPLGSVNALNKKKKPQYAYGSKTPKAEQHNFHFMYIRCAAYANQLQYISIDIFL